MNVKSIFTLLLMLIFFAIGWRYYTCNLKRVCCDCNTSSANSSSLSNNSSLLFYPGTDSPIMNNFDAYKDSICKLSQTQRIDLVGFYKSSEENNTAFDNLGLARAHKLRDLLNGGLNTDNVSLYGELKDCEEIDGNLVAHDITNSPDVNLNSSEVQLVSNHGKTEIYFPVNSNDQINSVALTEMIGDLVTNSSHKNIRLVGHTDNTGDETQNVQLSLQRSNTIKDLLVNSGFPSDNINCEGKGSSMPKVNNTTPENRALNRRVELTVTD